jgi:DNA-binding NarL/FixJ family response regulator
MKILLADDEAKVRSALRLLLEQQEGLKVVGEVERADGLMDEIGAVQPDALLLDWELPGLRDKIAGAPGASKGRVSWLGSLRALRALNPRLVVIALSGRPEARQTALDAGADAFVSKGDPPERLLAVVNHYAR